MNIPTNPYDAASVYTDLNGLNRIKTRARDDEAGALREVARQFESMFVSMMMKSMRDANKVFEEGNFMNSQQTEFYRQMFDSQLALTLTSGEGIGLAEQLYRQLSANYDMGDEEDRKATIYQSIQDYPRSEPVKSARMVEAMVEIDRLLEAGPTDSPTASAEGTDESARWEERLEKAEQLISASRAETDSSKAEPLPEVFDSPESFVRTLYPLARKIEQETGMSARFMLAQSALETGWGKHMIQGADDRPSFNLFGIKADQRWSGDRVEIVTTEYREGRPMKERAAFRAYSDYEQSFRDYVEFLRANPRYDDAMNYLSNPGKLADELQDAGYATDPKYSEKIQRIFSSDLIRSALQRPLNGQSEG